MTRSMLTVAIVGALASMATACGPKVQVPEVAAEPPQAAPASPANVSPVAAASGAAPREGAPVSESKRVDSPQPALKVADFDEAKQPAPPDLDGLAAAFTAAQVREVSFDRLPACLVSDEATTMAVLRTATAAMVCALGGPAPRCVTMTSTLEKARRSLCGESRPAETAPGIIPPAGLIQLFEPFVYAGWQARPLALPKSPLAELLRDPDGRLHLLVSDGAKWRAVSEPVASQENGPAGVLRLWATPKLGHGAAYAITAVSSEGGSEQGEHTTWLFVLCEEGAALRVCARKVTGRFVWALAPGERAASSRGRANFEARSHLEVALTPALSSDGASLRLRLTTNKLSAKLRARFTLPPEECESMAPNAENCGAWPELSALRGDAGTWRFDGQALVRAER